MIEDIVDFYRGVRNTSREEIEGMMKEGLLASGYHYFGDEFPEVALKHYGIDLKTKLEDLIEMQDATPVTLERKNGENCMPLISTTVKPEEARYWGKNGYVLRIVIPKSKVAWSQEEAREDTILFNNMSNEQLARLKNNPAQKLEDEWLTTCERLSPKYIAGCFDTKTGEYVPNGDHPENVGFKPEDHVLYKLANKQ